jgi:hypothetical protein
MALASRETINRFLQHPPGNNEVRVITKLREKMIDIAGEIEQNCPRGREAALAMTKIEEALMWAVKSLTLPNAPTHEIHQRENLVN